MILSIQELIQVLRDSVNVDIEDSDTESEIVDKVKNTKYAGRYQGINLQNDNTVEFRMFRGTLKLNTFIAALQFVDCICKIIYNAILQGYVM